MADNTREYAPPGWPQIIRHLMRAKELDKVRDQQLAQFHTSQTEILLHHIKEGSSPHTFKRQSTDQALKKMLWEDEVTYLQDPFMVPVNPQAHQATLSLRLNLKWIKTIEHIAEQNPEAEQVLIQLQLLQTSAVTEKEEPPLHQISPKKELDQTFFDNLLNLLSTSTPKVLIANLLSSRHEMHSLGFAILNNKDLWLHDPFKGSFLCKDKEKLKNFFIKFCQKNYPDHNEASIVQPGTKLKQELYSKPSTPELSSENATESRKNFLFSSPSGQESKTKSPTNKKNPPKNKPPGRPGGSFKKK